MAFNRTDTKNDAPIFFMTLLYHKADPKHKKIGHPKVTDSALCDFLLSEGDCAGSCDVSSMSITLIVEVQELNILVDELENCALDDGI